MKCLIVLTTALLAMGVTHSAQPLGGTHWLLERITSMDDAQAPKVPSAHQPIEVHFGVDGRAALRLDCNRGMAGFEANRSNGGETSGGLQFGALASTRAACAPGSLEPVLLKQLPYVRGWLLRDGRLHLSLMADGGILSFVPLRP